MSYILIPKDQLEERGLFPYAETLPDGRSIVPVRSMKTLSGFTGVDIVSAETVKALKNESVPTPEIPMDEELGNEGSEDSNSQGTDAELIPGDSEEQVEQPEEKEEEVNNAER